MNLEELNASPIEESSSLEISTGKNRESAREARFDLIKQMFENLIHQAVNNISNLLEYDSDLNEVNNLLLSIQNELTESIAMLRRYVAKCAGIVPPKFNAAHAPVATHEESENNRAETFADDDPPPF